MVSSVLSISEIKKRIEQYRNGDIASSNGDGLFIDIFGERFNFVAESRVFKKGGEFFRARAIPDHDHIPPLKTISKVEDAWEAPSEIIKVPGRLNKIGQSILYCCPRDPFLAIDEARAAGNKRVAIIKYRSTKDILLGSLGDYKNSDLPKDEGTELFYSFLESEFARDIQPGDEDQYKLTQSIADSYFNYPNQDAWYYRSVQSSEKFNLAFLPGKAKTCLELIGVMICDVSMSQDGKLCILSFVDFDPETGEAKYYPVNHEIRNKFLP
ncbi:RES domain-containing protein [Acinetobacter gerneri]|uniref:RES domain-containing protein n=1 Tax=Acinetobacter gerneri TaxID=202952 RepID=UPI003AF72F9D